MPKTKFPAVVVTFILCYAFWILLTWSFAAQELAAGAVVSLAVALFSARFFIHEKAFRLASPGRFFSLLAYILVIFPSELIKANCDVAKRCFGGCKNVNPGIVRVPSQLSGLYDRAMLANSITLTPGTITLDIAEDADGKSFYYVHCIDVSDMNLDAEDEDAAREAAGETIKGRMEKWIRRIWE